MNWVGLIDCPFLLLKYLGKPHRTILSSMPLNTITITCETFCRFVLPNCYRLKIEDETPFGQLFRDLPWRATIIAFTAAEFSVAQSRSETCPQDQSNFIQCGATDVSSEAACSRQRQGGVTCCFDTSENADPKCRVDADKIYRNNIGK